MLFYELLLKGVNRLQRPDGAFLGHSWSFFTIMS